MLSSYTFITAEEAVRLEMTEYESIVAGCSLCK